MPKTLRVLLIEDSAEDAELMLAELRRAGFAVDFQRVETREGFTAALSSQLDLVLADYTLPEFNGSEALAMLRASRLDVPFILVTGTLTEEQAVAIMMQGAFAAVLKHRLAGLGHIAVRALEERDLRRENRRVHGELASELDFRRAVEDSMLAGLLSFDMEGRITHANAAACRLFGYSSDELVGLRPPFPFWAGDREREKEARFWESVKAGKPVRGHRCVCRRRDGAPVSLSVEASPLLSADGKPVGQVALLYDITEQVEAEESLRRQARTLRLLSRGNEALVRAKSEQELLDTVCQVIAEQGGYPMAWVALRADDAAKGLRVAAKAGERSDYVEELRATWAEDSGGASPTGTAIREGRTVICRHPVTGGKMQPWCEEALKRGYRAMAALPLRENGQAFGALMIYSSQAESFGEEEMALLTELAQDLSYGITALRARVAREAAERVLKESAASLAAAQKIAHLGSWEWDVPADRIAWSDEMYRIFDVDPEAGPVGYKTFVDALHPDDRKGVEVVVREALAGRAVYRADFRVVHRDGKTRHAHAEGEVLRERAGHPLVMRGTVLDVTEHKKLEDVALHAQKMESVGRLAGGVAHDFNNLLMVILANCGFVLKSFSEDDPRRNDVNDIKEAAERAASLTRQLLIFSRKQVVHPETVELSALVKNLEKMLKRLIGEDIKIEEAFWPEPLPVRIDPGQLEQAITNLAVNARDAMPKGGTLRLRTRLVKKGELDCPPDCARFCAGACARIEVQDSGVGMSAEVQEHLFEPFFTTKPTGKGTGLGLSTVYGIVKQADGAISVRSAPGKGTTVAIALARQAGEALSEGGPAIAATGSGTETILLAEDEAAVRRVDARILRERGYEVIETASGQEALAQLSGRPVDLLLADVVMPGMSGPELAKRARALKPGLKVLFMSGYPEREELEHLKAFNGELLGKPVAAETLAAKVRQALDRKGVTS